MIDFTSVFSGQHKIADLATDVTLAGLKASTDGQIDEMVAQIRDVSDDILFVASAPSLY